MKSTKHAKDDVELASGFRVSDYEKARDAKDQQGQDAIADAIERRFLERYILPVAQSPRKHGFAIMAVSCLMIEALESFRQGWSSSEGKSKSAFCFFFDTAAPFSAFRGHGQDLYKHVRCGILHQAETTGGWVIRREGPLFDPGTPCINATKFIRALERFLKVFCANLKELDRGSGGWKRIIMKMDTIAEHCQV
jgi:hypothetical protein